MQEHLFWRPNHKELALVAQRAREGLPEILREQFTDSLRDDLSMPAFYEFFAGGGMARAGLGSRWKCLFANDIDEKKAATYAKNWGTRQLVVEDVARVDPTDLPGQAQLVWASFPCQDLSLAGDYAGLRGKRSGSFWPFWNLMEGLVRDSRAPQMVVLENVCGALTSHQGRDFAAICNSLIGSEYRVGALVIDAKHFLPQSRPRLFVVAVSKFHPIPESLLVEGPNPVWHPDNLVGAYQKLSSEAKEDWIWWRLPVPPERKACFLDVIEKESHGVSWHTAVETQRLLDMMSPLNLEKVERAKRIGHQVVGAIYRRTRRENGERVQRAEVRFDGVAGCLRTPIGGSSRQSLMIVQGSSVRTRLLSPREAARLMGLPDSYILPTNYNEAYHLSGDGVVVPVVRYLAEHLLEPLLAIARSRRKEAA